MTRVAAALTALIVVVSPAAAQPQPQPQTFTCRAAGVTDGDTIRCGDRRVRLWGIDAVERGEPGYDEASRALQRLTRSRLTCRVRDVDRYGRTVAQCFSGSRDVAGEMVRSGHAQDYPRFSGGFYAGEGRERRVRRARQVPTE